MRIATRFSSIIPKYRIVEQILYPSGTAAYFPAVVLMRSGAVNWEKYLDKRADAQGELHIEYLPADPNLAYAILAIDDTQTYQAVAISHRYATVTGARPGA